MQATVLSHLISSGMLFRREKKVEGDNKGSGSKLSPSLMPNTSVGQCIKSLSIDGIGPCCGDFTKELLPVVHLVRIDVWFS